MHQIARGLSQSVLAVREKSVGRRDPIYSWQLFGGLNLSQGLSGVQASLMRSLPSLRPQLLLVLIPHPPHLPGSPSAEGPPGSVTQGEYVA